MEERPLEFEFERWERIDSDLIFRSNTVSPGTLALCQSGLLIPLQEIPQALTGNF